MTHLPDTAMRFAFAIFFMALSGCQSAPKESPNFGPATEVVRETVTVPVPPLTRDEVVGLSDDAQLRAVDEMKRTGEPRVIRRRNGVVFYPYGESYPLVRCKVLRFCEILLNPDERIRNDGPALGDGEGWVISVALSGSSGTEREHVMVKPIYSGGSTNMNIYTTKRIYRLGLVATDSGRYDRVVAFYYPREFQTRWTERREVTERTLAAQEAAVELSVNPEALNHEYLIHGDDVSWRPVRAFDDGEKTFIRMPAAMAQGRAPVLYVENKKGSQLLTNYRTHGHFYVLDRLFDRAVLTLSDGDHAEVVYIERGETKCSFWRRLRARC